MKISKILPKLATPLMLSVAAVTSANAASQNKTMEEKEVYRYIQYSPQTFSVYTQPFSQKSYLYTGRDGRVRPLDLRIGQKWEDVNIDNKYLESIIDMALEPKEYVTDRDYVMINQICSLADSYTKDVPTDKVLSDDELAKLEKKIRRGRLKDSNY